MTTLWQREIPSLTDSNDGYPIVATIISDLNDSRIEYKSIEDDGPRDIGGDYVWDSAVAIEVTTRLINVVNTLRATTELLDGLREDNPQLVMSERTKVLLSQLEKATSTLPNSLP